MMHFPLASPKFAFFSFSLANLFPYLYLPTLFNPFSLIAPPHPPLREIERIQQESHFYTPYSLSNEESLSYAPLPPSRSGGVRGRRRSRKQRGWLVGWFFSKNKKLGTIVQRNFEWGKAFILIFLIRGKFNHNCSKKADVAIGALFLASGRKENTRR